MVLKCYLSNSQTYTDFAQKKVDLFSPKSSAKVLHFFELAKFFKKEKPPFFVFQ